MGKKQKVVDVKPHLIKKSIGATVLLVALAAAIVATLSRLLLFETAFISADNDFIPQVIQNIKTRLTTINLENIWNNIKSIVEVDRVTGINGVTETAVNLNKLNIDAYALAGVGAVLFLKNRLKHQFSKIHDAREQRRNLKEQATEKKEEEQKGVIETVAKAIVKEVNEKNSNQQAGYSAPIPDLSYNQNEAQPYYGQPAQPIYSQPVPQPNQRPQQPNQSQFPRPQQPNQSRFQRPQQPNQSRFQRPQQPIVGGYSYSNPQAGNCSGSGAPDFENDGDDLNPDRGGKTNS